ncbi:MAG TPA: aspartate/glutamate racemase family protein [Candidatus Paceibacterota bacterium]|nr:aspartate/glutamate racemase family protein [Candidatus Paceibacterota bacterium]
MIGVFDSGSGGLTVLKEIRERMPSADILYFGDIKNAPYGSKSHAELGSLTACAIGLLQGRGATSIVSACNSVSASLAISLFDALSLAPEHLIEMVGPTVSSFKDSPARLLLAATPATIGSEIYQNAFRMIGKEIGTLAIPDLASAIEFGSSEEEIEGTIRDAFAGVRMDDFDAVVLACTHYPLVARLFARVLGPVSLHDPALAVAERVKRQLWPREVGEGTIRFIISKDSQHFRDRVALLGLASEPSIEVLSA